MTAMKVFEGSTFAPNRITNLIVPADESHLAGRPISCLVLAANKTEALALLAGCLHFNRPESLSDCLSLRTRAQLPTVYTALVEAGLVDLSAPGCWFYVRDSGGRLIEKASADSVEVVGELVYDVRTSTFSVVPAGDRR